MSGSLTAVIDASGISAPDYPTVLAGLKDRFRAIYGSDAYLEPDSQDGQLLAVFALALHDANSLAVAVYNAFSPATAQGEGLSRVVKINGLARLVPSFSTCDVVIGGTQGTTISNGIVLDPNGGRWTLDAEVVIPGSGVVTASTTYQDSGAVTAAIGTLTTIGTPTRGWQTVTNATAAAVGRPVESDAALRRRQAVSTMIPSRSSLDGIVGAILALPNVIRVAAHENSTGSTDAFGVLAYSLALVVEGGDTQAIGNAIGAKKTPGVQTVGTTTATVTDVYSIPGHINFYRPTPVRIIVALTLAVIPGATYRNAFGDLAKEVLAAFIAALPMGGFIDVTRLYQPIEESSDVLDIRALTIARFGGSLATTDIQLAIDEAATCSIDDIALTVL